MSRANRSPTHDIGKQYGRWTIVSDQPGRKVLCVCQCGKERLVLRADLVQKKSVSCGCYQHECVLAAVVTHGASGTPEHASWLAMRQRCRDPNQTTFARYGARGITVCDRWNDSFEMFLEDMGCKPTPRHSIDRIDNSGGYNPGNCRWATSAEQCRNRTNSHMLTFSGETLSIPEWSARTGIKQSTIRARLFVYKWSVERALTERANNA